MPCMPKKTFAAALAMGNHLVAQLKKNQRTLFEADSAIVASNDPQDTAFTRVTLPLPDVSLG